MWGGLIGRRASATPGTQEEEDKKEATIPTEKAWSRTEDTNKDKGVESILHQNAGVSAGSRVSGFFGHNKEEDIIYASVDSPR